MMKKSGVIEIFNYVDSGRRRPQRGRVYGVTGVSPCVTAIGGGLGLNILVEYEDIETDEHDI